MFKQLAFIALLLNVCGTQTLTSPRIVKFDDAFTAYTPIENDCDWQEQVNIYSWRYKPISNCKLVDQVRFIVKEGLVLRVSNIDVAGDVIDLSSITYTNHS